MAPEGCPNAFALLAAAGNQRLEADARLAPHVEDADALWAVHLVARDTHEIDVHLVDIEGYLASGLSRIGVKESAALPAYGADLGERLDDADFVVHGHHRNDRRLVGYRVAQDVEVEDAVLLNRQIGNAVTLLLKMPA